MEAIGLIISLILGIMVVNWLYRLRMKITGTDVMFVNMPFKVVLYILATSLIHGMISSLFG